MPTSPPAPTYIRTIVLYGLFGFLLVLPWIQITNIFNPPDGHFFLLNWVVTGAFLLACLATVRGSLRFPTNKILWLPVIWLAAKLLATIFSLSIVHSLFGDYSTWTDGDIFLFVMLVMGYVVLMLQLKPREIKTIIHLFLIQATILSLQGLKEAYRAGVGHQLVRIVSPFGNSDYFLAYALILLPMAIVLFIQAWRSRQPKQLAGYLLLTVIIGAALGLSLPTWTQAQVAPKAANVPPPGQDTVLTAPSNVQRFAIWQIGLTSARQHLILGTGPGTTRADYFLEQTDLMTHWNYDLVVNRTHNDLIEQLSQTGIIGLIAYGVFLGGVVYWPWRRRQTIRPELRPYALGLAIGLVLGWLFSQVVFLFLFAAIVWWLGLALLIAITVDFRYATWIELVGWPKLVVGVTAICLLLVGYWSLRYLQADQLAPLAFESLYTGDYDRAGKISTLAVSVFPYESSYAEIAQTVFFSQYVNGIVNHKPQPEIGQKMVMYAQKTVQADPYKPLDAINLATANYLVAPAHSDQETAAIKAIDEAIQRNKYYYQLYFRAGQAFVIKGDRSRAKNYLLQARQLTPPRRIRQAIDNDLAS